MFANQNPVDHKYTSVWYLTLKYKCSVSIIDIVFCPLVPFHFILILLTCRKMLEMLYIGQAINLNLLQRYCCLINFFFFIVI